MRLFVLFAMRMSFVASWCTGNDWPTVALVARLSLAPAIKDPCFKRCCRFCSGCFVKYHEAHHELRRNLRKFPVKPAFLLICTKVFYSKLHHNQLFHNGFHFTVTPLLENCTSSCLFLCPPERVEGKTQGRQEESTQWGKLKCRREIQETNCRKH